MTKFQRTACSEKIYLCDLLEVEINGLGSVFRILWHKCESVTEVPAGKRGEKGAFNAYYNKTTGKYKPIFFFTLKRNAITLLDFHGFVWIGIYFQIDLHLYYFKLFF